ncbi:MAG TPA: hypothetical protein VME47_14615 [Acetobacteraceae bacterium]|nr:hypothetical protein [Acetobacteraceae bacterium]
MALRVVVPMTLIGVTLMLAGCATPQQRAQHRENLLAAAGFVQHPANTPQRQKSLQTLPPDRVVRTVHGDRVAYMFADPLVCDCLYVGDQTAWGNYQRELLQLHIANEQETAAQLNADAEFDWDWGPWGPGPWW